MLLVFRITASEIGKLSEMVSCSIVFHFHPAACHIRCILGIPKYKLPILPLVPFDKGLGNIGSFSFFCCQPVSHLPDEKRVFKRFAHGPCERTVCNEKRDKKKIFVKKEHAGNLFHGHGRPEEDK